MTSAAPAETQSQPEPTPYERIGGEAAVRAIVERFYDIMDTAPEAKGIRAMHGADLAPMRKRLFEFLSAWLGGPRIYVVGPGEKCIMSTHRGYAIGEVDRDAWMICMRRAMEDAGAPPDVRELLDAPFLRMANAFRSQ